ncbi:MFS transporter [Paenibacillus puerhi]|uniref:MFS transporter n=1 Tax=Paenibacillus puerhi TaxID=2692622 RepID=UPI001356F836|nr:MFS transporter [Paenibacillus puerhi]
MQLTGTVRRMLLMNASSTIIFNYIGIFVNLYIWEQSHRIFDVAWFNLIMFLAWGFSFATSSRLLTHFTTRLLIQITAVCGGLTFLLLTTLTLDNRLLWMAILATPVGIMWGTYASTQNITLSLIGKGKDFEQYFATASIVGQVISIINPVISALVIQWIGYNGSFMLMLVFVTILMVVSFFIPKITLSDQSGTVFQSISFRQVFSYSALRWMVPSCLAAGVVLQFHNLFTLIFTFSVSGDKLVIALLNVLYTLSTMGAMLLYRKLRVPERRWLVIGVVAMSTGFLFPLLQVSVFLVISNILMTIGMFYFGTVWNTEHFRLISKHSAIEQARLLIWREWLLIGSRVVILVWILGIENLHGLPFIMLLLISIACALAIPFFSKKAREAELPAPANEVHTAGA